MNNRIKRFNLKVGAQYAKKDQQGKIIQVRRIIHIKHSPWLKDTEIIWEVTEARDIRHNNRKGITNAKSFLAWYNEYLPDPRPRREKEGSRKRRHQGVKAAVAGGAV